MQHSDLDVSPAQHGTLAVRAYATKEELGKAAGEHAAHVIADAIAVNGAARVMFAAAPSQEATLATLIAEPGIDWSRVECFHMDDYVGLHPDAPQGFGNWLQRLVFDSVSPKDFHRINTAGDAAQGAEDYERIMGSAPFDLVLCGLGVNGHLAFNDPPADFHDRKAARVIALDDVSRQQQVDEGHFEGLEDVPTRAVTVTIPRLLNAAVIIASVPGQAKRQAVADTLGKPITGEHPGTILRTHPAASLYLDKESDPR
ncbi:6-phosphogluconolactonase [Pseudarthrobacter sp. BRE9]|uniref:6-phosphogluconolactonase n=1 Tax=Pseudarthrobacter sp. BRE9 TaxID=2962582 RepID=UPI002881E012|nr:6-phosphogluconolactonase [Pseudarthrobacter sp. BRE9]MDT0169240.1 6-phosphogluconolactonase [Pseudarthrobacter sp. BRE9]